MSLTEPASFGLVQTKHLPVALGGHSFGIPDGDLNAARPSLDHDIMYIEEHATYWYVMWRSNRYAAGNKPGGGAEAC